MKRVIAWGMAILVAGLCIHLVLAADKTPAELRADFAQGNYKNAYDGLAPRVLSAEGTDTLVGDFQLCINALNTLSRYDEIDDFRDKAVAAHKNDWRLLQAAAESYISGYHYGMWPGPWSCLPT